MGKNQKHIRKLVAEGTERRKKNLFKSNDEGEKTSLHKIVERWQTDLVIQKLLLPLQNQEN